MRSVSHFGGFNTSIKTFSVYLMFSVTEESVFISLLLCCCCGFTCLTRRRGIAVISSLRVPGCHPSSLLGLGTGTQLVENPSPSRHCCFPSSRLVTVIPLVLYKSLISLPCQTILLQRLQTKTRKRG